VLSRYVDIARKYGRAVRIRDEWGELEPPLYPRQAPAMDGRVVVRAYIGRDGTLDEAALIASANNGLMDDSAYDNVLRMSFEPARGEDGKAMAYFVDFAYAFDGVTRTVRVTVDTSYPVRQVPASKGRMPHDISAAQVAALRGFYVRYEQEARSAVALAAQRGKQFGSRIYRNRYVGLAELQGFHRLNAADLRSFAAFGATALREPGYDMEHAAHPPTAWLLSLAPAELRQYADLRVRALHADITRSPAVRPNPSPAETRAIMVAVRDAAPFDDVQRVLAIVNKGKQASPEEAAWVMSVMMAGALRLPPAQGDKALLMLMPADVAPASPGTGPVTGSTRIPSKELG
jgi:TonB family protein